jgi:hypothetical protein
MHCLVYHAPFCTKKYGTFLRFSGQGVERSMMIQYDYGYHDGSTSIILQEDFPKAFDSQTPSMTTNALHLEYPFCPNVRRNAAPLIFSVSCPKKYDFSP